MEKGNSRNILSSAFTDLMASLAVIFILLTVVFIKSASQSSQKGKEAVRESLAGLLNKNNLPLDQAPNDPLTMSVRVGEDLLKFAINSAKVSDAGGEFLDGFAPALARELCAPEVLTRLDGIVIEGHTDRSGEERTDGVSRNIRLSQDRSFAVLERMLAAVKPMPELYDCVLKLTLASGRGSSIPVVSTTGYSEDFSRRVEIKIRVKSAEQEFFLKQGAR